MRIKEVLKSWKGRMGMKKKKVVITVIIMFLGVLSCVGIGGAIHKKIYSNASEYKTYKETSKNDIVIETSDDISATPYLADGYSYEVE